MQLETSGKGKQRKAAQAELERAEARLAKYQHRISTGQSGEGLPKVTLPKSSAALANKTPCKASCPLQKRISGVSRANA